MCNVKVEKRPVVKNKTKHNMSKTGGTFSLRHDWEQKCHCEIIWNFKRRPYLMLQNDVIKGSFLQLCIILLRNKMAELSTL